MQIKVKKLSPEAVLPSYAHAWDAGMDLYVVESVTLAFGEIGKVRTGVSVEIPDGFVGLIWDKSGLSMNYGLKTLGGVIDSGYRGEIVVGVMNLGKDVYTFEKGHKVAQMLVQPVNKVEIVETDGLTESDRGEKGFGSTGK